MTDDKPKRPKRVPQPRTKEQKSAARDGGLARARRAREADRANRAVNDRRIRERQERAAHRYDKLSKGGKKKINTAAGDGKKGCAVTAITVGAAVASAVATLRGWA